MIRPLVAALLVFVLAPPPASAIPITDPSQLSPHTTLIDFENVDTGGNLVTILPNPVTFGDVTFTSLTGMLSIFDISVAGWPADGTEVASKTLFPGGEPDSAILITFASPVSEFLLGWGDPNFQGNVLRAYDAAWNLLEEAAVALGPPGGGHAAWIGFKRQTADIAQIVVQPDHPLPSGDDYVIDNIRYLVGQAIHVDATADTYVRSGAPNTNEGASAFLRVREAGDNRALVRFDSAAIAALVEGRSIITATLVMDAADNGDNWGRNGRTVDVHRMLVNWNEGNGREAGYDRAESFRGDVAGATWNCASDANTTNGRPDCSGVSAWEMAKPNRPDLHPWVGAPTASALVTNGLIGPVEWDVTLDVQAFLAGAAPNYGWIVKKTNEGQAGLVDFASRESGHGPRLFITLGP
jgi:hypothetical protein